ncbi:MAG: PEP-CTERM sorting domain-containing protein [Luteolibacter sp.]
MRALPLALLALTGFTSSSLASLVVTYAEDANQINSTLSGTSVFTFDSLAADQKYTNLTWNGVGTFDSVYVKSADYYGGAVSDGFSNGSPYSVQSSGIGGGDAVPQTTITLSSDHAYFGMWWSAGDANNILRFYSDETLVAEFTTDSLLNKLASDPAYKGNPRDRGLNAGEPYAFINFFGAEGTTWNRIVLTNEGGSGFESDNYTDRATPWSYDLDGPMPGIVLVTLTDNSVQAVPEPSCALLGGLGMAALLLRRRRN